MLDSIMLVSGETQRKFRFTIAVDQPYPMQAALDALTPITVIPTAKGPPRSGNSGWFFHLSGRNVQIVQLLELMENPVELTDAWDPLAAQPTPTGQGLALRLLETEGRPVRVTLQCYRTPQSARQRDFQGRTITDLTIHGDTIQIDMVAHEVADIEFRW